MLFFIQSFLLINFLFINQLWIIIISRTFIIFITKYRQCSIFLLVVINLIRVLFLLNILILLLVGLFFLIINPISGRLTAVSSLVWSNLNLLNRLLYKLGSNNKLKHQRGNILIIIVMLVDLSWFKQNLFNS